MEGTNLRMTLVRKKIAKTSVNYRAGTQTKHCSNCAMYHNGECDLVRGIIRPEMVCDKWVKKK